MNFKLTLNKGTIHNRYEFSDVLKQVACNFEQGSINGLIMRDNEVIGSYELEEDAATVDTKNG